MFTQELINGARSGNQNAITFLYRQTYNNVYQSIKAVIGQDEDTVLDLLQDTFIRAFQHLDQLDQPENFRAWVKRIGVNSAKNYLRKNKPVLFSELATEENENPEYSFEEDRIPFRPDLTLDQKETQRLIAEILESLSADQRLTLTMFYFNNMSLKEISSELGVSENAIKNRLYSARQNVKAKVLELEKKGVKLYGMAPFAFLLFLFRSIESILSPAPNLKVLETLHRVLSRPAAPQPVRSPQMMQPSQIAPVAKAAGKTVTTGIRAAKTIAKGKLIAGILGGIAVVAVSTAAAIMLWPKPAPLPVPVPEAPVEEEISLDSSGISTDEVTEIESSVPENTESEDLSPEPASPYEDILSEFQSYITADPTDPAYKGNAYGFYDLNGDGIEELIFARLYAVPESSFYGLMSVTGIYTVKDGLPEVVLMGGSEDRYSLGQMGLIHHYYLTGETFYQMDETGELITLGDWTSVDSAFLSALHMSFTYYEEDGSITELTDFSASATELLQ